MKYSIGTIMRSHNYTELHYRMAKNDVWVLWDGKGPTNITIRESECSDWAEAGWVAEFPKERLFDKLYLILKCGS